MDWITPKPTCRSDSLRVCTDFYLKPQYFSSQQSIRGAKSRNFIELLLPVWRDSVRNDEYLLVALPRGNADDLGIAVFLRHVMLARPGSFPCNFDNVRDEYFTLATSEPSQRFVYDSVGQACQHPGNPTRRTYNPTTSDQANLFAETVLQVCLHTPAAIPNSHPKEDHRTDAYDRHDHGRDPYHDYQPSFILSGSPNGHANRRLRGRPPVELIVRGILPRIISIFLNFIIIRSAFSFNVSTNGKTNRGSNNGSGQRIR